MLHRLVRTKRDFFWEELFGRETRPGWLGQDDPAVHAGVIGYITDRDETFDWLEVRFIASPNAPGIVYGEEFALISSKDMADLEFEPRPEVVRHATSTMVHCRNCRQLQLPGNKTGLCHHCGANVIRHFDVGINPWTGDSMQETFLDRLAYRVPAGLPVCNFYDALAGVHKAFTQWDQETWIAFIFRSESYNEARVIDRNQLRNEVLEYCAWLRQELDTWWPIGEAVVNP